jgi:hypothetical protein
MSAQEVIDLEREFDGKLRNDPEFHAQRHIVAKVLDTLEEMGRLEPAEPHDYAAYIITAALHKHGFPTQAQAYDRGMADQKLVQLGIRTPGRNPYQEES